MLSGPIRSQCNSGMNSMMNLVNGGDAMVSKIGHLRKMDGWGNDRWVGTMLRLEVMRGGSGRGLMLTRSISRKSIGENMMEMQPLVYVWFYLAKMGHVRIGMNPLGEIQWRDFLIQQESMISFVPIGWSDLSVCYDLVGGVYLPCLAPLLISIDETSNSCGRTASSCFKYKASSTLGITLSSWGSRLFRSRIYYCNISFAYMVACQRECPQISLQRSKSQWPIQVHQPLYTMNLQIQRVRTRIPSSQAWSWYQSYCAWRFYA